MPPLPSQSLAAPPAARSTAASGLSPRPVHSSNLPSLLPWGHELYLSPADVATISRGFASDITEVAEQARRISTTPPPPYLHGGSVGVALVETLHRIGGLSASACRDADTLATEISAHCAQVHAVDATASRQLSPAAGG